MNETIIIAIIGSSALSALISGLVTIITSLIKKKKGNDELMMMNSAALMTLMAKTFLQMGYADGESRKLFLDMYKLYKDKDGNGYVDNLKDLILKLPIEEDS